MSLCSGLLGVNAPLDQGGWVWLPSVTLSIPTGGDTDSTPLFCDPGCNTDA